MIGLETAFSHSFIHSLRYLVFNQNINKCKLLGTEGTRMKKIQPIRLKELTVSSGDAVRSLVREVELHMPCHQKKEKKKKKKQKQYCNKFNKAFKKKLRCSRGKLSGCYKLLPSAFRGLWAFWELQRKGVLSVLFTGGSALSQDEGEGWYPCAEHPLCKQGLALHQSSHLALVGWSGNHDSRLPPPGGDKIFSRH